MIALINEQINRTEEYLKTNNELNAKKEYKTRLIKRLQQNQLLHSQKYQYDLVYNTK